MTVYVVQEHRKYNRETGEHEPTYDLSPAQEYGELRYLLSPTAAPWRPQSIIDDLYAGLEGFGPDDYLLMMGNPVLIGLATAVVSDINDGHIKFLQWHGRERKYIPVEAHVFGLSPDVTQA